jgi:hypothetical protein
MHAAHLALASLPLLTGCATLGDWWSGPPAAAVQAAPAPMPEQEYRRVAQELAVLRDQQADVAAALPRAQDSVTRIHHVRHINSITERIEELQSQLRAAGRPGS